MSEPNRQRGSQPDASQTQTQPKPTPQQNFVQKLLNVATWYAYHPDALWRDATVPIESLQPELYGSRPELPIQQIAVTELRSHGGREDKSSPASLLLQTEDLNRNRRQRHNPSATLRLGRVELPFVDRLPNAEHSRDQIDVTLAHSQHLPDPQLH